VKTRKIFLNILISGFLLVPFFMWIFWILTPSKSINILIIDKTVLTKDCREHKGFNWILTQNKYVNSSGNFYNTTSDYFGFFPSENKKYKVNDFSTFSDKQIDSICNLYQMLYYTDTYGIYKNSWYLDTLQNEHSEKIYGGLDEGDYLLLKQMKAKKKLILAEFNFIAAPTREDIRTKTENLLNIKWSGWTGKYFSSLDTLDNPELPKWVIKLYKAQHEGKWDFTHSGIVFVNNDGTIAILENKTHLQTEVPTVSTTEYGCVKFDVPEVIGYPYWFDIISSTDSKNKIVSTYKLGTNPKGDSILNHYHIPKEFPAVVERKDDYRFYYFCGDFCDAPVSNRFLRFKGIRLFELFILNKNDLNNRLNFYWRFYYPMVTKILSDYYEEVKK